MPVFLGDATQSVSSLDYSSLTNSLTAQLNATTILNIMGTVVGATVGIFLAVWGGRKIIGAIQTAMKRGNIRA
ncbi:MAG: hypothetical protein MRZ42_01515 [Tenericutes bacterium]|nr:hypothetical protein [Mycoplasmatota bacterium]